MRPDEHYRKAEALVEGNPRPEMVAKAQVHATLAACSPLQNVAVVDPLNEVVVTAPNGSTLAVAAMTSGRGKVLNDVGVLLSEGSYRALTMICSPGDAYRLAAAFAAHARRMEESGA